MNCVNSCEDLADVPHRREESLVHPFNRMVDCHTCYPTLACNFCCFARNEHSHLQTKGSAGKSHPWHHAAFKNGVTGGRWGTIGNPKPGVFIEDYYKTRGTVWCTQKLGVLLKRGWIHCRMEVLRTLSTAAAFSLEVVVGSSVISLQQWWLNELKW